MLGTLKKLLGIGAVWSFTACAPSIKMTEYPSVDWNRLIANETNIDKLSHTRGVIEDFVFDIFHDNDNRCRLIYLTSPDKYSVKYMNYPLGAGPSLVVLHPEGLPLNHPMYNFTHPDFLNDLCKKVTGETQ